MVIPVIEFKVHGYIFFKDLMQQNDCGKEWQKFLFQPNSTCFDNISFLKFCIKESFFTIDNMSQVWKQTKISPNVIDLAPFILMKRQWIH